MRAEIKHAGAKGVGGRVGVGRGGEVGVAREVVFLGVEQTRFSGVVFLLTSSSGVVHENSMANTFGSS